MTAYDFHTAPGDKSVFLRQEAARCLLCQDPACTAACPQGQDPAGMLRSLRFENPAGAAGKVCAGCCEGCAAPCQTACIHYDFPLRIRQTAGLLDGEGIQPETADLSIPFCGLHCENPFFLSSSVVAGSYEMCARALKKGWAGIVFKTIGFYKPEEVSPRFSAVGKEGTPFMGFRNLEQISDHPLAKNLEALRRLKRDFPHKIIVASIMGQNEAEWESLARMCSQAGADILECNFSCPQMAVKGMGADVGQDPELVARYTAAVRRGTDKPVLAKMTPNTGNMEPAALAAVQAGADGLAAINTIKSVTGLNLEDLASPPDVDGKSAVSGYSGKAVKPIALRFVHDLAAYPPLAGVPISGMGGIENWRDAAEFLALGCRNVQITTAVMEYGYDIIDDLCSGLGHYLVLHGWRSLSDFCGSALENLVPAQTLDRESVVYPIFRKERCIGCGRCYVSCRDGGHQAIRMDGTHRPQLLGSRCVGCHLCRLVCPVEAVGLSRRVPKPRHAMVG